MKNLLLTTAALVALATAANAETMLGCEVVKAENGNYFNLVDPTCDFTNAEFGSTGADEKRARRKAAEEGEGEGGEGGEGEGGEGGEGEGGDGEGGEA